MASMDPEKVCRACLKSSSSLENMLLPKSIHLFETYMIFTQLNIVDSFTLICHNCAEKLVSSFEFLEQCLQSEEKIKDLKPKDPIILDEDSIKMEFLEQCPQLEEKKDLKAKDLTILDEHAIKIEINDTSVGNIALGDNTLKMCSECDFTCYMDKDLTEHLKREHNDLFVNWCLECKVSYDDLQEHMERMHRTKEAIKREPVKEKKSSNKEKKNVVCEECGKCFGFQSLLDKHKWKHLGEMPFTCTMCNELFSRRDSLRIHMRLHIQREKGEKDEHSSSEELPKEVTLKKAKKNNKMGHICSDCGGRFDRKANLMRHRTIHSGEKPLKCDSCDKSFRLQSQLKLHTKTVHKDDEARLFKCLKCDKSFITKGLLDRHSFVHITAYNRTMERRPDESEDFANEPLPSISEPMEVQDAAASTSATPFAESITAAPKPRAQIQREYRQRIAASRTPAQAAAAREARNVRDRNYRSRQAVNSAIASGSLEATTTSSSRSGQRLNTVHIDTQRPTNNVKL